MNRLFPCNRPGAGPTRRALRPTNVARAALIVAMAAAGSGLGNGAALAQTARGSGTYGSPGVSDPTLLPATGTPDLNPYVSGNDGSAQEVGAPTGSVGAQGRGDPTDPAQSAQSVSVDAPGDPQPSYLRITPAERASRYYGATRQGGDLTPGDYSNEDYTTSRGKTPLRPNRLGVFDQNFADHRGVQIKPYIEADQVIDAHFKPDHDVVTYSVIAAGVDGLVNGRNNQGAFSLRYERRFDWGKHAGNSNAVTGVARMSSAIVPDTLRMDYGGYANRTNITAYGAALTNTSSNVDALTQVYSVYAGPTLTTHSGDLAITGHYRFGYTKIGDNLNTGNSTVTTNGQTVAVPGNGVDIFSHSTVHDAKLAAGVRPGDVLPVGLSADAGFYQENVSNLSQKIRDVHARGEVTIPVTDDVAFIGGAGYEGVQISSRDAVRDVNGNPVVDRSGRYVTNNTGPRYIAFDTHGLIWDAGLEWRPSRRTNLELHVGRRYGSIGGYGTFNYQPNEHTALNLVVYDDVAGFGGALTNTLYNFPTQFATVRDAITGNISSCVASLQSGNCLAGVLGATNSAVYRSRGVSGTYGVQMGSIRTGFGMGYDRRRYYAAPQTVLATVDGKVDQYYWAAAYLSGQISEHQLFESTFDVYRFQSGLTSAGDLTALRAVVIYQYLLAHHLTATASLATDGIERQAAPDLWSASGSVGMRYTF